MFGKIYKLDSPEEGKEWRNRNCLLIFNPTMDCNARYYDGGTWITPLLWAYTIPRTTPKHDLITGNWANYLWQERGKKKKNKKKDKKLASVCKSTVLLSTLFCSTALPRSSFGNKSFSLKEAAYVYTDLHSGASFLCC